MDGTGSKESPSLLLESIAPQPTIAALARSCLESFKKCLDKAAEVHPRESTLVENQIARFSVWTANIGVFARSRASLDHRLREALDVQDAVGGLLEAIELRAQSCLDTLHSVDRPMPESLLEPVDPKFDEAIEGISQNISLLHKLSNTIRRASKETHKQKAATKFHIKDEEGNDAESFLEEIFTYQVRDRFPGVSDNIRQRLARTMLLRRKRILYRRSRYQRLSIGTQVEQPPQPEISAARVRMKLDRNLHHDMNKEAQGAQKKAAPDEQPRSVVRSMAITATTLAPDHFKKASAPSVVSMSKTVALSKHDDLRFPPAPCELIKRKFNKMKSERDADLALVVKEIEAKVRKVEEALHNDGQRAGKSFASSIADARRDHDETLKKDWEECLKAAGEVVCPFCFCTLPASEVADDRKWREHLKGDLDPYVCLFEGCESGEELYTHSHAWLKHMREHKLTWKCKSKSHELFTALTRDQYLDHMREAHSGKFSDAQLGVLADRNGRAAGALFRSCPLCGATELSGIMEDHIVGHMRLLALKSLPPTYEENVSSDDDLETQQGSSSTSASRSRSTLRQSNFSDKRQEPSDIHLNDNEYYLKPEQPTSIDPDCAICAAPASLACDCEAKALDAAIKKAEERMMTPMYADLRAWVRSKSEDYVLSRFRQGEGAKRRYITGHKPTAGSSDEKNILEQVVDGSALKPEEKHSKSDDETYSLGRSIDGPALELEEGDKESEMKALLRRSMAQTGEWGNDDMRMRGENRKEASNSTLTTPANDTEQRQNNDRRWQECYSGFPGLLDYYFSLVECTVPPDDDPMVRDPPLIRLKSIVMASATSNPFSKQMEEDESEVVNNDGKEKEKSEAKTSLEP